MRNPIFYIYVAVLVKRKKKKFEIYSAKSFGIVTLKVSLSSLFRYKAKEISIKFTIPKINLNRIDTSYPAQVL